MKNKLINKIALLLLICVLAVFFGSVLLLRTNISTVPFAETIASNTQSGIPQIVVNDLNQGVAKNATTAATKSSKTKTEKTPKQEKREREVAGAINTTINGVNKEIPSFYKMFKSVADGEDFDTAAFMDSMTSFLNSIISAIGTGTGNPFIQIAGSALQLLETIVKTILRGENATSEIAQMEDRVNQQFDDIKLHLSEMEEKIYGLSNQINESTNKIIAAMSTALDNADAKQYLRTFMLGGEGNFSYNQFRNYICGATTNNSKANTAYFGLLKQHLINGSPDEIVKYYYDELYTALMDNRDAYYDYLVGDSTTKSIMQYYYDVVSARPDLVEDDMTPELAAVQFAYDLYYTELVADRLIVNCNDYQFVQMTLAGEDYYTLNSGKIVTLAEIEGANGIDSMYDQIELREAELLERIAKDLAYILNLDGSYTVEEMSGDVYQLVDNGDGQFGNVLNNQTIYLDSSLDIMCQAFGIDRNDYTYTLNSSMIAEGVFVVDDHTSTINSSLYYKGEKICGIDFTVDANGKFVGGTGAADDPYLVGSIKQCKLINDGLGNYYQLLRDIDFGDATISPIGYSESVGEYYEFTGLLDGNGFTIKNLNVSGSTHSGLFGKIGAGGLVHNLTLHNVKVTAEVSKATKTVSSFYVGMIAGENSGAIQYCHITCDNEKDNVYTKYGASFVINNETHNRSINAYVGGVAGVNNYLIDYCTVEKCKIAAESYHEFGGDSTKQNKNSVYAGGLCGYNYGFLESSVVRKTVSISAKAKSIYSPKNTVNPYVTAYAGGIAAAFGDNVKPENVVKVYSEVENLESEYELELKDSLWGKYYKNCNKGTDKYVASYTESNFESNDSDKLKSIKAESEQEVLNSFTVDERNADKKLYTVEVVDGYKTNYEAGSAEFDTSDLKIKVNGKEVEHSVFAVYGFDSKNESLTATMSESVYMLFFAVIDDEVVILSTGGIDITIGVNKVASIDVLNLKDEYVSGTFSVVGMTLKFNYAVGSSEYVTINESNKNEVKVTGDIDTFGTSELQLAYNGHKINYSINIICGHDSNFTDASSGYIHDDSLSQASTCCEVGYDAYVCATCGDVKRFYYAKLPHVADEENAVGAVPATCYAEGNTGVIKCANCDYVFDEGSVIPKIAHAYVSYNDTLHRCDNEENSFENHQYLISESVEQTVDSNGAKTYSVVYTYTCQSCGHVRTVTDSNTITEEEQSLPIVMVSSGYALKGGDEVVVCVQLINNPGIYAANFGIRYDRELELIGFADGPVLAGSIASDSHEVNFGYNFVWGSGSKRTEDGNLLKLTFRVPDYAPEGQQYDVFVVYDVADGANGGFALSSRDKQCFVTRGGTITIVKHLPGDVNSDNNVDLLDVLEISRHCVDDSYFVNPIYADVNLDGVVDVLDMVVILQSLTGGYGTNILSQEFKIILNANGFDAVLSDLLVSIYNDENNHYNNAGLHDLIRDGYKFDGWYNKLVGGEQVELGANVQYNPEQKAQVLYAHWTMNEIEFISGGATNDDGLNNLMPNVSYESVKTANGSARYEIDSPYKREYDIAFIDQNHGLESESGTLIYYLAGWMGSNGKLYRKDAIIDLAGEHFGKITLTALWLKEPIEGHPELQEPTLEYPTWAINGYEDNVVWYANSDFAQQSLIEKNSDILKHNPNVDGVYILYAKFNPIEYQVKFVFDENTSHTGYVGTENTGTYNSVETPFVLNGTVSKAGFEHAGWIDNFNHFYTKDTSSIGAIMGLTEQNQIVTLRPVFGDAQTYSIYYHLNDKGVIDGHKQAGQYVEQYTVESEIEIRNASYVTYPEYNRFVGWYTDEACTTPFVFNESAIKSDPHPIDLYPKWDLCMEYKTMPEQVSRGLVASGFSSRAIIDLSSYKTTNLSKRLKISNTITELIIIGNGEVFNNFSMYLDGFVNCDLDVRFINFKFRSNVNPAIGFSECQSEKLTIYTTGTCLIETSCSGGSIIGTSNYPASNLTLNVNGSTDMIAGDGYNAEALSGNGDNGGTAIWADSLQLDISEHLGIYGGNGGNGKVGESYGTQSWATGSNWAKSGGDGGNGGNGGNGINATNVSIIASDGGYVEIQAGNGGVGANGGDGQGSYCDGAATAGNGGKGGNGGNGGNGIVASSLNLEFYSTTDIDIIAGNGGVGGNGGDGGWGRNKGKADDGGDGGDGGKGGSGGCAVELATISNLSVTADVPANIQMSGGNGTQGGRGGTGGDAYEEGTRKAYAGDGGLAGNNGDAGKVIFADNKNYAINDTTYKNGEVASELSTGGAGGDGNHGHDGASHANEYGAQGSIMAIETITA